MKKIISLLLLTLPFGLAAETYFQDFSLTYLKGDDYEVGDNEREVFTFEYVNVSSWGDTFLFVDRLESDNGDTETYAEFAPRYKLMEFQKSQFLSQVSLSTQVEFGEDFSNYLYGLGFDVNIPGFQFLKFNTLKRNNDGRDNNYQLTTVWAVPFELGNTKWHFDGFSDWASASDDTHTSLNITPQLKLDIAQWFDRKAPVYIGVEYVYWRNKFGIKGITENNVNLLAKFHF
jgi:nucleoside-specific outer membrane channel protein Tsx